MRGRLRGNSLRIKTPVLCRDCTTAKVWAVPNIVGGVPCQSVLQLRIASGIASVPR
jgi:hypothetical protein